MKIYVPEDNTYNKCYVLQNDYTVRAYDTIPHNNTNYNYRDYYIKSDYYYKEGSGNWGNNFTSLPTCISSTDITHDFYYRYDFTNILIDFLIISIIGIYLPFKVLFRLFRRFN